ncbi:MAG: ATP-binding protein [Rhizobiaceae bacterium]|nr:ATP-binding protein [Rhizobiaceae bacterium]
MLPDTLEKTKAHGAASEMLRIVRPAGLFIAVIMLSIWAGGLAAQPQPGPTTNQPKQILFLYSLGPNFQPWATWSRVAREEMNRQSPWPLDIREQSLVTALDGQDAVNAKFVEYLTALYTQREPDLIVAIGAPAARFVQQYRADLFPNTPMLLAAVEVRRVQKSMLSGQDTVVATHVDHVAAFENILHLLPDTKTIAMIIGNSPGEQLWIKDVQRELKPLLGDRVELRLYNDLPFEEVLHELANLPPDSAIFFQQLMVDGAGAVYGDKEPWKRIAEIANAPIFTQEGAFFDGGFVGGPMLLPSDGGAKIAAAAIRILGGEKASDIHDAPISFAAPIYDWRQLQRWNIRESLLPSGSEIKFREPTAWERYSWQIISIAIALLLQAGLIAVLLHERHRRQLAEVQSRERLAELAHVNRLSTAGELSSLIAHEINQPLGAILANAEAAQIILKRPRPDMAELSEIVDAIQRNDERATEVIRRMRSLLKKAPFELTGMDLNDVVKETIELALTFARGRQVELRSSISSEPLPIRGDRVQLQQVILNLIVNSIDAMGHISVEGRNITIRTSRDEGFAELSVSDRGPGIPDHLLKQIFDPFFTTKAEGMGMGLAIARTIVEAHGGTLQAQNQLRGGARLTVRLPYAPS